MIERVQRFNLIYWMDISVNSFPKRSPRKTMKRSVIFSGWIFLDIKCSKIILEIAVWGKKGFCLEF